MTGARPSSGTRALTRPEQFRAVAGLSVPFSGVPARPFTEIFTEAFHHEGPLLLPGLVPEGRAAGGARPKPTCAASCANSTTASAGDAPGRHLAAEVGRRDAAGGHGRSRPVPGLADAGRPRLLRGRIRRLRASSGRSTATATTSATSPGCSSSRAARSSMPTLLIGGDRDPAFNGFGRIADPARHDAPARHRPARRPRAAGLRALDPAGAAGRGHRHPARLAEGSLRMDGVFSSTSTGAASLRRRSSRNMRGARAGG